MAHSVKIPRARRSRAVGIDLEAFSKSYTSKCKHDRRPGKGIKRNDRSSDFGKQLEMKQAIRDYYGLRERQFRNVVAEAERLTGSSPDNLIVLLESRLDNLVCRMGFAVTRREARQLIVHRKITLNGRVHQSPSTRVKVNDVVAVVEKAKQELRILTAVKAKIENEQTSRCADWFDMNYEDLQGKLARTPDANVMEHVFKPSLVIEFSSKS